MYKHFLIYGAFLFSLIYAAPAYANVVWPGLYIAGGILSPLVIILGLITESLFVKHFTQVTWKKAGIVTFCMNLITTIIGVFLIPISGLLLEAFFYKMSEIYDIFNAGSFHWTHWLTIYILIILFNTLVEGLFVKFSLKLSFKKIFWWMYAANTISAAYCFVYLIMKPMF